jgi:hypothetical protein
MRPVLPFRPFASVLAVLILVLAFPSPASGQAPAPGAPTLAPGARDRLSRAASDTRLPTWQRDFMLRLVRESDASAGGPASDGAAPLHAERLADDINGVWSELIIDSRGWHGAVYDPLRDRMLVFGGVDSSNRYLDDVWALPLAGTPTWYRLNPTGARPAARYGAVVIYDPVRDRLLVFGGRVASAPGNLNDVWALSLSGAPAWTALAPTGTPPAGRYSSTGIYDPVRERVVVFGGATLSGSVNDVWALSLSGVPAWTALAPTGTPPVARFDHNAIYDPVRDRMVVFGGWTAGGRLADVWVMPLASPAWTALSPDGWPPNATDAPSAVYDSARDAMLVVGGLGSGSSHVTASSLSFADPPTWTQLYFEGTQPAARFHQAVIYDPVRDRAVLFGGATESGGARNDVWALALADPPAWTDLTRTGTPPKGRNFASAIYDAARARMVVFGGATVGGLLPGDLWALSLSGAPAWSALAPTGTPPGLRYGHSAIHDGPGDRMVVFGGLTSGSQYLNEVWMLSLADPPAWTQLAPAGTAPTPRAYHTAIHDPVRNRMLVFGGTGFDGVSYGTYNDVWALSLAGAPAWTQLAPAGTPPYTRREHSAIYDPPRDRMVVFGGDVSWLVNDAHALSLAGTPTWTALSPSGTKPTARRGHSAIYDPLRDRMVVFGGNSPSASADTWALSLTGSTAWSALSPADVPPDARSTHVAVYDAARDRMVAFGGSPFRNDVWALGWSPPVGVDDPPAGAPVAFLWPPAPNPSYGATMVRFSIPRAGRVRLVVHDVTGRRVRTLLDEERGAGAAAVVWDGAGRSGARLPAGVYFVGLSGPGIQAARRAVLLD